MTTFVKPIVLTSPLTKYPKGYIKTAQELLSGHNHFSQNFYPGPADDVMGPQTAGAISRAKNLLGYPTKNINSSMGLLLFEYLNGTKTLPPDYLVRRTKRAKKIANTSTIKTKALQLAIAEIGTKESPANSNLQKYGAWYGFNGVAWCCIFFTWCEIMAGDPNWTKGQFAAACSQVTDAARHGVRHLSLTDNPEPGDAVIYNNGEHIERFKQWINEGTNFVAVGGNTSAGDGSYSNGGEVASNTRYVHGTFPVTNFVRIGA